MEEPIKVTVHNSSNDAPSDEPLKDMTVGASGVMEETATEEKVAITGPEMMGDVTPPPHDEVIRDEPKQEEVEVVAEPAKTEEADGDAVKQESTPQDSPHDAVVHPEQQKETVILPAGADPEVHHEQKHHNSKKALVLIVVSLALVLVAIVVLVFMKTNSSTKDAAKSGNNTPATASNEQTQATPKVTATEVDTTAKEVDDTINALDDNKDFATDELSDKALGL